MAEEAHDRSPVNTEAPSSRSRSPLISRTGELLPEPDYAGYIAQAISARIEKRGEEILKRRLLAVALYQQLGDIKKVARAMGCTKRQVSTYLYTARRRKELASDLVERLDHHTVHLALDAVDAALTAKDADPIEKAARVGIPILAGRGHLVQHQKGDGGGGIAALKVQIEVDRRGGQSGEVVDGAIVGAPRQIAGETDDAS